MNLGEFLKDKRKEKGLSQRQLAEYSGVSNTEISRLEAGTRQKPSPKVLSAIAPHLGVTYGELLKMAGYIDENSDQDLSSLNTAKPTITHYNPILNDLKNIDNIDFVKLMIKAAKDLPEDDLKMIADLTKHLLNKRPKEFKNYISYIIKVTKKDWFTSPFCFVHLYIYYFNELTAAANSDLCLAT